MTPQNALQRPLARVYMRVVQVLALQAESSPAHTVEAHRDGLRVRLDRPAPLAPVYAYALPWSRGWTVFTSTNDAATNQDWHNHAGFSQRVSNPRNVTGPQNVDIGKLINAFIDAIDYLEYHYTPYTPDTTPNEDYIDGAIEDEDYFDEADTMSAGDVVFNGLP
jgi:hypothetical protein